MSPSDLTDSPADTGRTPAVGDRYLQHGGLHWIRRFQKKAYIGDDGKAAVMTLFHFSDTEEGDARRFYGVGSRAELVWSEPDGAWYLPGRVLALDERTAIAAIAGNWPPAAGHLAMRGVLDHLGAFDPNGLAGAVDLDRMTDVVRARRLTKNEGESEQAFGRRCRTYAKEALEHCERLRIARKEWMNG